MTKSIMLTVSPTEALNVLNGNQTVLLRKRVPKGYVGWCYGVVSKGKPRLSVVHDDENGKTYYYLNSTWGRSLNGDVVARWWHEEPLYMKYGRWVDQAEWNYMNYNHKYRELLPKLCLTEEQVTKYGDGKKLYAISITKLEVFDKPMMLGEMYTYRNKIVYSGIDCPPYRDEVKERLTKSPSTYQYVWVKEKSK